MIVKRKFSTFSLSFLDIMSCGFGAVILVFLIIKHDVNSKNELQQSELQAEVNLLQEEVSQGKDHLVKIKNSLAQLNQDLVETDGLAKMVNNEIDAIKNKIVLLDVEGVEQQRINMEIQLQSLFVDKKKLEQEIAEGNNARRFSGYGERQYIT